MNTTMPDEPAVTVEPDHVTRVRAHGPGSLILCHPEEVYRVSVTEPGEVPDTGAVIIAGADDLAEADERARAEDARCPDASAATVFSGLAGDLLAHWSPIAHPGREVYDLRRAMSACGWYLAAASQYTRTLRHRLVSDTYMGADATSVRVRLTTAYIGTAPASAVITDRADSSHLIELCLGVRGIGPGLAPRVIAAAITAALQD